MALGTGLLFILWNLACSWIHREVRPFDLADLLWLNGLTMGVFMTAAFVVRNSLMTTATNRRLVVLFGSGFVTILTFWGGAYLHSQASPGRALEVLDVIAFSNLIFIYFGLAVTFTMDGRVAWVVPIVAAGAIAAPAFPELAFEVLGLEGFIMGVYLAWLWRKPRPPRGPAVQPEPADPGE
jgi:hypothetical protein